MKTMKIHKLMVKPTPPTNSHKHLIERYTKQCMKYDHQQQDALRLLAYFNRLYQRRHKHKIVYIPITRIRNQIVHSGNDFLVKFIASIWFIQEHRGNSRLGKVSAWSPIVHPELNTQMRELVRILTLDNQTAVQEMWIALGKKHTLEINIQTTVQFKNDEQAALFMELINMKDKS